jgi:hypothetical protein
MLTIFLSALMLSPIPADQNAALDSVRQLSLRDQHGTEDSLQAHEGNVLVVLVVTAKRLRNIRPWEKDIREQLGDVDFLRITDVADDSTATFERIAKKLQERVPKEISVLIDVERRWATALGLDTGRPNILLIDGDGKLVAAYRGRHSPELAAAVIDELRAILAGQ